LKKKIEIIDEGFNLAHAKQYVLAVLLHGCGFSFTVYHHKEKNVLYLVEYENDETLLPEKLIENLDTILKKNEFVYAPFFSCKVGISTPNFSVIPQSFFEPGIEKQLLNAVTKLEPTSAVESHLMQAIEQTVLFENDFNFKLFFKKQFLRLSFTHAFTNIYETWFSQNKNKNTPQYLLHFQEDYFWVALINNNTLQCVNAFKHNTPEDFIYYFLFVLETHKVSTIDVEVTVYGNVEWHPKHYELLKTYIANITFGEAPNNLIFAPAFSNLPLHQYGAILYTASCE